MAAYGDHSLAADRCLDGFERNLREINQSRPGRDAQFGQFIVDALGARQRRRPVPAGHTRWWRFHGPVSIGTGCAAALTGRGAPIRPHCWRWALTDSQRSARSYSAVLPWPSCSPRPTERPRGRPLSRRRARRQPDPVLATEGLRRRRPHCVAARAVVELHDPATEYKLPGGGCRNAFRAAQDARAERHRSPRTGGWAGRSARLRMPIGSAVVTTSMTTV
jgi:hypothetical protein